MHAKASARAPASIGNVAAGYDCLGLAIDVAWDEVTAHRQQGPSKAALGAVGGLVSSLPKKISRNTALRAAQAVLKAGGAHFGVRLDVIKGVPMSAGMGGSAASAVAAALASNALLAQPLSQDALFTCAMEGEAASADPPPPDNVAAALYGDLVLIGDGSAQKITPIPLPHPVTCLVFHPDLKVKTDEARDLLSAEIPLPLAVTQMRHMGGLIAGCFMNDLDLIAQNLRDVLVEPQRARLVPPFNAVKEAALRAGALGCSLSGSGPSIFAWVSTDKQDVVKRAMGDAFAAHHCDVNLYSTALKPCKAGIIA